MKMQTTVYAPKTGTVGDVLVKARDSVEAHDLLLTIN
jgi:biotin carboxyl carrier protein